MSSPPPSLSVPESRGLTAFTSRVPVRGAQEVAFPSEVGAGGVGTAEPQRQSCPHVLLVLGTHRLLAGPRRIQGREIQVAPPSKPARARGTPGTRVPVCVRGEHVVTEEESASVGAPVHVHKLHRNRAPSRT